ncbi:hypothetical protein HY373_00780 [Candidatus Berkelbacteria bacterium]|nr:hypothetical protein [Candidatus Berkelbacteria bacterium]MBI4029699.1 hypothetical protein [Candidatus Berkelbacteria bacterium]
MTENKLGENIEKLTLATEKLVRRTSLWYGFWHGILVGIGSTLGVVIILTVAIYFLNKLVFVPVLGPKLQQILSIFEQAKTIR